VFKIILSIFLPFRPDNKKSRASECFQFLIIARLDIRQSQLMRYSQTAEGFYHL